MKTIILVLFLGIPVWNWSQNPDLLGKNWVVSSLTVNSVTTTPNYHPVSFPYVELFFYSSTSGLVGSSNQITQENCAIGFTGHLNYNGTNDFVFNDFTPFNNAINCTSDCNNFSNAYVEIFNQTLGSNFQYTIIETGVNAHTLTITNINGDSVVLVDNFYTPTPELIDRTWTLSYMIMDGEQIFPENFYEINYILNLNNNQFNTSYCNWMAGEVNFFDDENFELDKGDLYLYDTAISLMDYCTPFEGTYINFYWSNIPQPFQYELLIYLCSCPDELHITDVNGNVAVYYDATMSSENLEQVQVNLLPNPTENWVEIQHNESKSFKSVELYNNLGQNVIHSTKNKFDVTHLPSGIYTVDIHWENGSNTTKKLIKK